MPVSILAFIPFLFPISHRLAGNVEQLRIIDGKTFNRVFHPKNTASFMIIKIDIITATLRTLQFVLIELGLTKQATESES
tara:strand:+ start:352 stop:591 length:240 start_codon:yes stop_codon:yes gene_type:complete